MAKFICTDISLHTFLHIYIPPTHPPLPPPSSYTTTVLTLRIMLILDIILHPHDQTKIKIIQIYTETWHRGLQAGAEVQENIKNIYLPPSSQPPRSY